MKPMAETWFETRPVGNGITRIREVFLDPVVACNIWHIRGRDADILFDSGTGIISLKKSLPRHFSRPVISVSSHTHFDHIGGSYEFKDRRMHPAEAQIITRPTRENTTIEGYMNEALFGAWPFEGFNPAFYQVRPAPPTLLLSEGDLLDLGDRSLEVLHLPGHSPGSIGLYETATQTLFSGDAVYEGRLYDDVYHSNIPNWCETMKRLLELPVSRVHGGHFNSFDQATMHTLINKYLEAHE